MSSRQRNQEDSIDDQIRRKLSEVEAAIQDFKKNKPKLAKIHVPRLEAKKLSLLGALKSKSQENNARGAGPSTPEGSNEKGSDSSNRSNGPRPRDLGTVLRQKLKRAQDRIIRNRQERAFLHYQIASFEARLSALHDARIYYRVRFLRSDDYNEVWPEDAHYTAVDDYIDRTWADIKRQKEDCQREVERCFRVLPELQEEERRIQFDIETEELRIYWDKVAKTRPARNQEEGPAITSAIRQGFFGLKEAPEPGTYRPEGDIDEVDRTSSSCHDSCCV
ncbi:hypothetical protein QAD02_022380 [Eretmocerus hayati]|uniref:Uncharacterized protein n=1 Tax=Eretmocerus hayati TaxID=131215 RepID=A0ACC2PSV1_9HYME|nr:hypothetical protein QAD02_022380 [Eretmocerus hayati]